jgi:hypothetical protein
MAIKPKNNLSLLTKIMNLEGKSLIINDKDILLRVRNEIFLDKFGLSFVFLHEGPCSVAQ